MTFLGVNDPQDLDPDEVERLEHLLESPIRINGMSESELRSCGLFSPYQVAVISDYIERHGDIMSLTELSLLDGFGELFVRKVAPFVSLKSYESASSCIRHEVAVRGGSRWQNGCDGNYGAKYRMELNDKFTAVFAASRSVGSESWFPSAYSGSIAWKFQKVPVRIFAGDFNARFGQGLVLWNNSFINTLTDPDAFMKKPTGISQPWSFTGANSLHGLAAEWSTASIKVSAVAAFEELLFSPAVNVAWHGRYGQTSVTCSMSKIGADAAFCLRGVNMFGEFVYNWSEGIPAVLMGTRFRAGESLDMAYLARVFPKDQYSAAAACVYTFDKKGQITLSADATYYPVSKAKEDLYSVQVKSQLSCDILLSEAWKIKCRLSERYRTWGHPFRTDVRTDVSYTRAPFVLTVRMNVLNCDGTGYLSYVEGGFVNDKISMYLRQGVFCVDDWDDRIYVYERDAPGSFTSPAMYGRGLWTSFTSGIKLISSLKLYARASYLCYPFMEKKKPGKAELKLQLHYRF